jgi:predicted metalloendopeptidase
MNHRRPLITALFLLALAPAASPRAAAPATPSSGAATVTAAAPATSSAVMSATAAPSAATAAPIAAARPSGGLTRAFMDTSCAPCRDFFKFANGAWYDAAQIPPAYTTVGAARELADRNTDVLYRALENAAARAPTETDPTLKKLGDFYASCMDSERADREGVKPVEPELARIGAIANRAALESYLARLVPQGRALPFQIQGRADLKNSALNIANLVQGGLGLPERDYYTRTDSASVALRNEYVAHIGRLFRLVGADSAGAARDAATILSFETRLANASMTRVAMRDPNAIYHKMSVAELQKLAPGFNWSKYFTAAGLKPLASPTATLNVATPDFMKEAAQQIAAAPLETWRAYLRYHALNRAASRLGTPFYNEDFAFNAKLTGQRVPLPRWKRCAAEADMAMGEALGRAYVASEFPPAAKARALEMVNNLQIALRERIAKLEWMSDSTKARALEKLGAVLKKIGYPDQWRDYTKLQVSRDSSYVINSLHANEFEAARRLDRIGHAVDRTEWGMSPPTVNAYYNPQVNEIVFPAGIMQPPNFDPNVDDAYNYGAMGMVIGHEMTHGFDDQGRQFDAQGNLTEWWTAADAQRFKERADKIAAQYDGYVAVDTLHVNGRLTLGENIADLGGVTVAYWAYQHSLIGKPRTMLDGYTPEQRFFLGFAQGWRRKVRPETERLRTLTDPHSPARWRVNGPLSNFPEFAKAWGCRGGDAMIRADQVTIW